MIHRSREKEVTIIFLLGILIREAFSFWTGHPSDFELWVRLGYGIVHGGNPYGTLTSAPELSFANLYTLRDSATIAYLPFWALITAMLYSVYVVTGFDNRFVYYFLLKQPVILGDMALAYLLYSYVSAKKPADSIWALRLWSFSPFTIILSGIWGMFDSIAMSFVVISIMTASYLKRAFWEGMGIFVKSIPVIYAVPLAMKRARSWLGLLLALALPAAISLATFAAMGWPLLTITSALSYTVERVGESMSVWDLLFYLNYAGILPPLKPDLYTALGLLWIPGLIAFTVVAFKKFKFETDHDLVQSLLVMTLAFLIFKARVTEQYAIYLLALSIIDVALWNPRRRKLLMATMTIALIYLVTNNYLLIRFLSPLYPSYMQVELELSRMIGSIRLALNLIAGSIFTFLNVRYLSSILKQK